ncbi:MAG: TolC family protein [Proteobacteria bacterium]|nr:TolC family protein [Pseudomonadota bacterium]
MKIILFRQTRRTILCILPALLLLIPGCLKPDSLPVFQSGMQYPEISPVEAVSVSRDLQPQFTDEDPMVTIAQGSLDLAVEQAIWLALRNNRDLKIQQIKPMIAGSFEAIERGVYDPELFGELEFSREKSSEAGINGSRITVIEDDRTALIGLRQKLPTGTTLEAAVEHTDDDTDNSARIGLSITQSLLRGLGPAVNLVSVRQAAINTAVSNFELRGITEALLAETEIAYWNYVLAARKIDIFERSQTIALQQLDEIVQRIEVGTLPRIEAAAAKAEVARRQQALIDVHSALEESRLRLLRLINPGEKRLLDLQINATSTAEINPQLITDLADRLLLAEKSRPDLNEARLRLRQNRLETINTRNGLLPRLDLFITLGKSGYADSFSESFKDLDGNNHDFSVGIKLSQYLNNRPARARDFAARSSWRQATEALENLKQIVELDVRLAMNEFERTRQQIAATRTTRLLQEETLQAEEERFDVGASTALQVAQAQRDLLESAIDEVEATINCRQALVSLYRAEGSLLERRGVQLGGSYSDTLK